MTVSIGTVLRRAREKRRLTQDDVSKYIKVPLKYIRAMELDDYTSFCDKVHAKGFLKLYSNFLGLSADETLALWRREYEKYFESKNVEAVRPVTTISSAKFLITPSIVVIGFISVSIVMFFSYLFFQYRTYTGAPSLSIYNPKDPSTVVEKDMLDITGTTDLDSDVYINNQKVILNPDGSFAESVKLKEGLNTLSIKAVNKLEKQTEYIRTVIFRSRYSEYRVIESSESTGSVAGSTAPFY